KLLTLLKTDGIVIFEAFAKEQLDYQSGGPKVETMLFSLEEVMEEFEGLEFIIIQHAIVKLEEGKYHQGEGAVIRFVGQKLRNY
ncbi:MAG: SAM-dependent methyltransferase, partial [Flavobacterium stagni]